MMRKMSDWEASTIEKTTGDGYNWKAMFANVGCLAAVSIDSADFRMNEQKNSSQ